MRLHFFLHNGILEEQLLTEIVQNQKIFITKIEHHKIMISIIYINHVLLFYYITILIVI